MMLAHTNSREILRDFLGNNRISRMEMAITILVKLYPLKTDCQFGYSRWRSLVHNFHEITCGSDYACIPLWL